MLFVILLLAVVGAGFLSARLCRGSSASRIYGSLLGALVTALGVTLVLALKGLIAQPHVTLWRLVTVGFHALCIHYPLVFLGAYVVFAIVNRRGKARHAGFLPFLFSTMLSSLAVALLIAGFYALRVEPNWIQVTHTRITTDKWPKDSPPLRIVQLSDLHIERFGPRERKALHAVERLKPDMILLTGDYANDKERHPDVNRFMKALHAKYGVYAIHGNWNLGAASMRFFEGTDVRVIEHRTITVRTPSGRVIIGGIPWYAWSESQSLFRGEPIADRFTILLSHMPEGAEYAPRGVGLVLAGHTHGGQVRIPGIGPVITFSKIGRERAAGLTRLPSGVNLYVNRGLGMEGGSAPRIRFLCRPEISVFTVKGNG